MSVARFVADQGTMHRVPHVVTCAILGVSLSWLYKWINRGPTLQQARRAELDTAVKDAFDASQATYGSPRVRADLVEAGWTVSTPSRTRCAVKAWRVAGESGIGD